MSTVKGPFDKARIDRSRPISKEIIPMTDIVGPFVREVLLEPCFLSQDPTVNHPQP